MSLQTDIAEVGRAVTFTDAIRTHSPLDGGSSMAETTINGWAFRVRGSPKLYEALGVTIEEAITLLFIGTTGAEVPGLGMTVDWAGETYTLKNRKRIVDGNTILSRVVVSR